MKKFLIKVLLSALPFFSFSSCSSSLESPPLAEIKQSPAMTFWSMSPQLIVDTQVLDLLRRDSNFMELVRIHGRLFFDMKSDSLISLNLEGADYMQKMVDEIVGCRLLKLKKYLNARNIPLNEYQKIYIYIQHEVNLREQIVKTRSGSVEGDATLFYKNGNTFISMVQSDITSIKCFGCAANNTFPLLWRYYAEFLPSYMGIYSEETFAIRDASNDFKNQIRYGSISPGFNTEYFEWNHFFSHFEHNCKGTLIRMIHKKTCSDFCPPDTGGGGGTTNPPIEPEESCNDTKCPTCKKCLNPTKPNCVKCTCSHDHKNCMFCNKCIKSNDDACVTRSATHTTNCPTCDCVCPSCGVKINPVTMAFDCMIKISEIFVSAGPDIMRGFGSAFSKMITTATADNVEYGGLLSKFSGIEGDASGIPSMYTNPAATYLIVFWDKTNNTPTKSYTYLCGTKNDPTKQVLCQVNHKPTIIRYHDYANIHTHPDYLGIKQENIYSKDGERYMSYVDLRVTKESDIKSINKYGLLYILNSNNVYELRDKEYTNGKAKIVSTF